MAPLVCLGIFLSSFIDDYNGESLYTVHLVALLIL